MSFHICSSKGISTSIAAIDSTEYPTVTDSQKSSGVRDVKGVCNVSQKRGPTAYGVSSHISLVCHLLGSVETVKQASDDCEFREYINTKPQLPWPVSPAF